MLVLTLLPAAARLVIRPFVSRRGARAALAPCGGRGGGRVGPVVAGDVCSSHLLVLWRVRRRWAAARRTSRRSCWTRLRRASGGALARSASAASSPRAAALASPARRWRRCSRRRDPRSRAATCRRERRPRAGAGRGHAHARTTHQGRGECSTTPRRGAGTRTWRGGRAKTIGPRPDRNALHRCPRDHARSHEMQRTHRCPRSRSSSRRHTCSPRTHSGSGGEVLAARASAPAPRQPAPPLLEQRAVSLARLAARVQPAHLRDGWPREGGREGGGVSSASSQQRL